jgi:hypothetical protein
MTGNVRLPGASFGYQKLRLTLAAVYVQLRSAYTLSYHPTPANGGYDDIKVEMDFPERAPAGSLLPLQP